MTCHCVLQFTAYRRMKGCVLVGKRLLFRRHLSVLMLFNTRLSIMYNEYFKPTAVVKGYIKSLADINNFLCILHYES